MLYLLLAITSSASIAILMRLGERYVKHEMNMFLTNYLICTVLSWLLMENKSISVSSSSIYLGVISGFLYLVSFVFLKVNMKHNGMVLATTFMKLGILIPTILAVAVFHEVPKVTQILGIVVAVVAIITIHFEKGAMRDGGHKSWLLILLLLSGLGDAMANIFEQVGVSSEKDGYLLITFFTALILSAIIVATKGKKVAKSDLLFGALIGIPNYFSSRFLLLALADLDAVLVYPVYSIGTLVTITTVGVLVFREALTKKKACALGMIVIALCLLNI